MKKYSLSILLLCAVLIIASCVKDKGFDDNKYGIKDPSSNTAVSIPLAVSGITVVGVDFVSTSQSFNVFGVQLESANVASTDIHINLVPNAALVSSYNSANAANLIALPSSTYNIPSLKVTIPAGSKTAYFNIVIPNASTLSPLSTYGLGFTIGSIDEAGISIPSNMKNIVVQFSIKNKYDGIYKMSGVHNRSPYDADPYKNKLMYMITAGPNAVYYYWAEQNTIGHPITNSNSWYGASFSPTLAFDLSTNKLTSVYNFSPAGTPPMTVGDPTSRFDPATKTIYAQWYYNNNLLRMFTDTLKYVGPR